MNRMTGTVTQVLLSKGYAFVRGVDDGLSRFVYCKDVEPRSAFDTLHEGQHVTFVPGAAPLNNRNNGLRAWDVRPC